MEFIKESDVVFDALLVECLKNHMSGPVCGIACSPYG